MIGILGRRNIQYSGRSCYRHVDRLIRRGRRVLIVSPYVDDYYAKFLLANSQGKEIYLLSSSVERSVRRRLEGRLPAAKMAAGAAVIAAVEYMLFAIGAQLIYLFLYPLLMAVALYIVVLPRRIKLKVPKSFVHAKLYISEDEAVRGSANLTYRGMHSNIEHIEVVRDRKEIGSMANEFWRLWNSS
ncbi:MAG: hypothetical protein KGH69_03385 [Candidatus Micrarchaeota archaeon]|nr:hypothetical protein [Candidatus Micrarchaeota archaeon]